MKLFSNIRQEFNFEAILSASLILFLESLVTVSLFVFFRVSTIIL